MKSLTVWHGHSTRPSLPAGTARKASGRLSGRRPLHLANARPFGRLKAPLGLSLLRCAAQTRTFENTLISADCEKKKGELWQKERGLDGASPPDKFFKSETGYRTILSNRFCKRSNISSSTVRKVRSDRKFKR